MPHSNRKALLSGLDVIGDTQDGPNAPEALARAVGMAAGGLRTSVLLTGADLADVRGEVRDAARSRIPLVVHWLASPEHDPYFFASETGAVQLFAGSVQEAGDFALIARRLAEEALVPVVCGQDFVETARSVQVAGPFPLGFARDARETIEPPTVAQRLLWPHGRSRMPAMSDLDHPAGLGGALDGDSAFQSNAAEEEFFTRSFTSLADAVLEDFHRQTGRHYARAEGYRIEDAEYVVVAQGSIVPHLKAAADHLREREGIRAGVVAIRMYRPFPADRLTVYLAGKKAVTVLACSYDASGERVLTRDMRALTNIKIYSGVHGAGGARPSFDDLCAVFRNMVGGGTNEFYIGARFERPDLRIPLLERQQQLTRRAYPELLRRMLTGKRERRATPARAFQIRSKSPDESLFAGRLAANLLFATDDLLIHGMADEETAHPKADGIYTVVHGSDSTLRPHLDGVVVTSAAFLGNRALQNQTAEGALVVVDTDLKPKDLWYSFTRDTREWVRRSKILLATISSRKVADETALDPLYARALRLPALIGAFAARYDAFAKDLDTTYREYVSRLFASNPALAEMHLAAFQSGGAAVVDVGWPDWTEEDRLTPEPEASWAVKQEPAGETLFDVTRFWKTTGYLNAVGESNAPLADPALATAVMPPLTSLAEADGRLHPDQPVLDAARCTACGSCWTLCPQTAISATIQDVPALLETAVDSSHVQLARIAPHLSKQARKVLLEDDLHRFTTLGALFDEALSRAAERMNDDQREAVYQEYAAVRPAFAEFPVLKTDRFFREPERAQKGSGLVFSLTVNPDLCTACGICEAVCEEGALERGGQASRGADAFMLRLPDVPLEHPLLTAGLSDSMLHRRVRYARAGGGGDGAGIALHLVFAAVEAKIRPLTDRISTLIDALEKEIRRVAEEAVRVNDLDAFQERLSHVEADSLDSAAIGMLVANGHTVDRERLSRLSETLTELHALVKPARCMAVFESGLAPAYPSNPYPFPWICREHAPAAAEGLFEAAMQRMAETFALLRRAARLVGGDFAPDEALSWREFTDDEMAACPKIVAVVEHDSPGFRRVLDGDRPIKILYVDGYPATDSLSWMAYPEAYVVQSSIGYPDHLMKGLEEGIAFRGPALLHVYAARSGRDDVEHSAVIAQSKAAVDSRAFPLAICRPGGELSDRLDLSGNPDPGEDWTASKLTPAHWAVQEGRYSAEFSLVPRKNWGDGGTHVEITGADGKTLRKTPSQKMIDLTRKCLQSWRTLQEAAGIRSSLAEKAKSEAAELLAADRKNLQAELEARDLAELDERYRTILSTSLLELSGFGPDGIAKKLREFLEKE